MLQGPTSLPESPVLQRAHGLGRIAVRLQDGRTRLERLHQDGCAKIRLPDGGAGLEAVLINSAGGVTGGDRIAWRAEAAAAATLTLTTQACEKVYRARDGVAEVQTHLTVARGGRIDWLPQETILFNGGALARTLDVDLEAGATLLACEAVILGRTAMDETVRYGVLRDRWRVRCGGRLVFADDLRLDGPIAELTRHDAALAGDGAFASLLMVGDELQRRLDPLRAALGSSGGASVFDGKLFARVTAPDGFELRRALIPALEVLRDGAPLPRAWRL